MIEFGHIYLEDIMNETFHDDDLMKERNIINENSWNFVEKVVLIDNKEFELSLVEKVAYEKKVKQHYESLGFSNFQIFFEADFVSKAMDIEKLLHSNSIKKEFFRKDNKYVYFCHDDKNKIHIKSTKNKEVKYSCVFLSTAWLIEKTKGLNKNSNHIILNKKYEKIEYDVNQLLKILNQEMNIKYHWYE